jgi:hypothetical protein
MRNMSAFILAAMFLFSCHPKKELSPEDAIRTIKVLDSDVTNFVSKGEEHPSFVALDFLLHQATSPLSTNFGIPAVLLKDSLKSLESWNGIYTWNKDSLKFFKTAQGKEVKMLFPLAGGEVNDVSLGISRYASHPSMSAKNFPAEVLGMMDYNGKNIMKILYKAEFEEDWPSKIQCDISGDGFEGYWHMERKRKGDDGSVNIRFDFSAGGKNIIEGKIKLKIGYNGKSIYTKTVEPDITLFELKITGLLDYGMVDPTSKEYIKSFNDNCHIVFREKRGGWEVGNFGLGNDKSGELMEWVLYLSDGSQVSFYDYILVFKKIMDYKYPNKFKSS